MSETLPSGWTMATLGDLTAKKVDQGPPTKQPVPYIDIGSIDRDFKRILDTTPVTATDAPTRARQWVRKGDVLVSMTRPNLNAVALVGAEHDGAVASTGFDVLRSTDVLPEWLYYRVRTNEFIADVCGNLQGVVYPAIRPQDVRRHQFPVPPPDEQRHIVATIESYVSRLDAAVSTLKRVQQNLKRYRASVLKAAVEGRLVPTEAELAHAEGREYEPVSVLLERILVERRRWWEEAELAKLKASGKPPKDDKWKAKYKEPVQPDMDGLPELPEGWCWATVDQLAMRIESGTATTATSQQTHRRILRSSAVRQGSVNLDDHRFLPTDAPKTDNDFLAEGDLLFTRLSGTLAYVGNCAVMPPHLGEPIEFPDRIFRARMSTSIQGDYVTFCFSAEHLRRRLEAAAKSSAGHQRISLSDLREFCIPVPPLSEQKRIAECVESGLSIVSSIEAELASNRSRCAHLRQSILKWAFEGKLAESGVPL